MKKIVITGSQSGMGLAFRKLLENNGNSIIGVDLPGKQAEVEADLSSPQGRQKAIEDITKLSGGKLDAVVANAGVDNENVRLVFELNYFGVIDILNGLRPLLIANGNSRIVITASNSVVITPGIPMPIVHALMTEGIDAAVDQVGSVHGIAYQISKMAVVQWMRSHAATGEWAGKGITMNAIAPGAVYTPLLEKDLNDPNKGSFIKGLPKPLGDFPKPDDIAGFVKFLVSDEAKYIVGQLLIIDGGMEATWRTNDWPSVWSIEPQEFMKKFNH